MNLFGKKIKLTKGQIKFSIIYFIISLFFAFLLFKHSYDPTHAIYSDIPFTCEDGSTVSNSLSLPSANILMNVVCSSKVDTELYVSAYGQYLASAPIAMGEDASIINLSFTLPKRTSNLRLSFPGTQEGDVTVYTVEMLSDHKLNRDNELRALFALFIMFIIYVFIALFSLEVINSKQLIVLSILLGISVFASSPLMNSYLIYGHDIRCHVGRIDGVRDAIMDGQLIPMIIPEAFNGFGVLGFEYPQLFLIFPAILRLCDVSMVLAYEVFLFSINMATSFICFFSIWSVIKHAYGKSDKNLIITLISTVTYVFSSYRLSDVYIRAAMGEMLAMMFLPMLIAGLYHLLAGDRKKWFITAIALTGILQSHILSCVLILPLIFILLIAFIKSFLSEKRWIECLYAGGLFIAVNLWYIIPFIRFYALPLNTSELTQYIVTKNIVYFREFFSPTINFGFEDGTIFSHSMGLTSLVVILIVLISLFKSVTSKETSDRSILRFNYASVICFIICLIFSSEIVPWDFIEVTFPKIWKLVTFIQFPYRLLTICCACLVFMLAIALIEFDELKDNILIVLMIITILSLNDAQTLMDDYTNCGWITVREYTGGFSSYIPKDYLPGGIDISSFSDFEPHILSGDLTAYEKNGTNVSLSYSSIEDTIVTVPLNYYPCYKAVDESGNRLELIQMDDKRIGIVLPAGTHNISMKARYSLF